MRTRSMLVATAAVAASALTAPAFAYGPGPSGSSENGSNNVSCNSYPNEPTRLDVENRPNGVNVHGNTGTTYAGTDGAEACGDNGNSWRGRVIVSSDGSVTYDGASWAGDPLPDDNGCGTISVGGLTYC